MKKIDRIKLIIDWDTEQEDGTYTTARACGLPKQVYVTREQMDCFIAQEEEGDESVIADWLSDEYGYCVNGVIIDDPKKKKRRK